MSTPRISAADFRAKMGAPPRQGRVRGVAPKDVRTYGGRVYASKGERVFAERLDLWVRVGIVRTWTPQVRAPLYAHGLNRLDQRLIGHYVIDFGVELVAENAPSLRVEIKPPLPAFKAGAGTQLSAWKMEHFRLQHPELLLLVLGYNKAGFTAWPTTSLEDLHALAEAGLELECS